jgi:hypothetical protein
MVCAVVAGCSAGAGREAGQEAPSCDVAVALATLPEMLGEASGIARDPRRADLFWVHNDSGNEPLLVAVDTAGRARATVRVTGGSDRDLEDIALGRCGTAWCLYLGDIGDNRAVYPGIRVHQLPLPDLPPESSAAGDPSALPVEGASVQPGPARGPYDGVVSPLASWELVYPGGPRDAEGLIVDDARRELLVVTKGRTGPIELYAAPFAELEATRGEAVVLRRAGRLAIPVGQNTSQYVTAADLSPDGTRLAIRSYANLFLVRWRGSAAQDSAEAPAVASLLTAFEPQGEGLGWGEDGETIYLASEGRDGRPPQLSRIRCPRP